MTTDPLPQSREIEAQLLAGLLHYPEQLDEVAMDVRGSDFAHGAYSSAWSILCDRWSNGHRIDVIELRARVGMSMETAEPKELDGLFQHIAAATPVARTVSSLAASVRELSERRRLILMSYDFMSKAKLMDADVDQVRQDFAAALMQQRAIRDAEPIEIHDVVTRYLDDAEAAILAGTTLSLRCGIVWLDRHIQISRGHLILLGAVEKTGKTWVLQQIARGYAEEGYQVAWISTEMDYADVSPRILASWCGSLWVLEREPTSAEEIKELREASTHMRSLPIRFLYEKSGDRMLRSLAQMNRQRPMDVVFVDYLQDFRNPEGWGDRYDAQVELADRLKEWAKREKVGVWMVSGANKRGEENKAPTPSQMVGRRRLLHLMDGLVLLYRPSQKDPNLIHCGLPAARHQKDRVSWWIGRNVNTMEFEEVSERDAKERIKNARGSS